jgi:hypothetical protein
MAISATCDYVRDRSGDVTLAVLRPALGAPATGDLGRAPCRG